MSNLADISLITKIITLKSPRAFKELMERHQNDVRRYLLSLTGGDSSLADDLSQECFIKVYQRLSSFKQLSSFKSWLYRIATNCFYDYIRAQKPHDDIEDTPANLLTSSEQKNLGQKMDINKALQILTITERTCVTLFYMEDIKIDKIAKIINMPSNTVKSHLKRGRKKMAEYLSENGYKNDHL